MKIFPGFDHFMIFVAYVQQNRYKPPNFSQGFGGADSDCCARGYEEDKAWRPSEVHVVPRGCFAHPSNLCRLQKFQAGSLRTSVLVHGLLFRAGNSNELACVYAALICHDDGVEISGEFPLLEIVASSSASH